jgi:hypothetical protein
MIDKATSIQFIKQVNTFNRPIIAICRTKSRFQTYFLKYARTGNETDGLFSELVCSRLARKLHLKTPDIALVEIGKHPIDPDEIDFHQAIKPGTRAFGSKGIENASELNQLQFVFNKHDFNRLENPIHILRIVMYDLWIGNTDRSSDNFNLLISQGKKQNFYVFDHFEAFAKISDNRQQNIPKQVDALKGFLGTKYGYEMLCWIPKDELKHERDKFLNFVHRFDIDDFLEAILEVLPQSWKVKDKTISYIHRFLTDKQRLHLIEQEINKYIKYLPIKV